MGTASVTRINLHNRNHLQQIQQQAWKQQSEVDIKCVPLCLSDIPGLVYPGLVGHTSAQQIRAVLTGLASPIPYWSH